MMVKAIVRKGRANTRVSLVDGSTVLVPSDKADSLIGKECPPEYLSSLEKAQSAGSPKPAAVAKATLARSSIEQAVDPEQNPGFYDDI